MHAQLGIGLGEKGNAFSVPSEQVAQPHTGSRLHTALLLQMATFFECHKAELHWSRDTKARLIWQKSKIRKRTGHTITLKSKEIIFLLFFFYSLRPMQQ